MAGFAPLSFPRPPSLDAPPPSQPTRAPESPPQAADAPPAITPVATPGKRLEAALKALRWTYGTLAVELRLSPSTTRNWGLGRGVVPGEVLAWVEDLAGCHAVRPPPR